MDRKEFLAALGLGAAAVVCSSCLSSCKPLDAVTNPPTNVDFTLDLNDPANAALKSAGGYIYSNNVIVAHLANGSYVALSSICTHAGGTVSYDLRANQFYCPVHGSTFSTDGSVTGGPAGSALMKYTATLSGTSLHVHS